VKAGVGLHACLTSKVREEGRQKGKVDKRGRRVEGSIGVIRPVSMFLEPGAPFG